MDTISSFDGKYRFLSNFDFCIIEYDGMVFKSVEAAFQAMKTNDRALRFYFQTLLPNEAKRKGRLIYLRSDWDKVKDSIMLDLIRIKFSIPVFRVQLLETDDAELIEGNWWGDKYWGVDSQTGEGLNKLGKILMQVREEIRRGEL